MQPDVAATRGSATVTLLLHPQFAVSVRGLTATAYLVGCLQQFFTALSVCHLPLVCPLWPPGALESHATSTIYILHTREKSQTRARKLVENIFSRCVKGMSVKAESSCM